MCWKGWWDGAETIAVVVGSGGRDGESGCELDEIEF